jgi:Flp pilus assembly protein TadB
VAIWALLYMVNPDYALILARKPEGRMMLLATLAANVTAHFVIRKLTQVRI